MYGLVGEKMGYRPTISTIGYYWIELGKFYGYIDLDNLKSIKWLVDHRKIEADEIDMFNWAGYGPEIDFTAEEFREFIDLYQEDLNTHHNNYICYPPNYKIEDNYPLFKQYLYDTEDPKTITWG